MTITEYTSVLRKDFEEMLVEYFTADLQSDISEDIIRGKLASHIISYVEKQITHLAIMMEQDSSIGFSCYQIDTPDSDWCKRPGWGCIREFYIRKEFRGRRNGTILAAHTEKKLRDMGAEHLYLTSDDAIVFWERCGWRNTHEMCSNDSEILTK